MSKATVQDASASRAKRGPKAVALVGGRVERTKGETIPRELNAPGVGFTWIRTGAASELIQLTRQGMPASLVDYYAGYLNLSRASFVQAVDLKLSTIERRLANKALLTTSEGDRLYRTEKIIRKALEVFEDEEAAKKWVKREIRSLGGVTPLSLLDTDAGVDLVMDTLGRIEQGIVA